MSLFSKVKALWDSSPANRSGSQVCVLDPAYHGSGNGKHRRERMSPGIQVKILQRVSRFAEKESLRMAAVFEGNELRVVPHGGDFHGVKVFFESEASAYPTAVMDVIRTMKRAGAVTLITDDPNLSSQAEQRGIATCRYTTFKKALDGDGAKRDGNPTPKSARNPRRNRSRRHPDGEAARGSRQGGSDTSMVREMIDLVE